MEWVNTEGRIPIKSWCADVDESTMRQANNLANLPFAFRHVALMPDGHFGYGMPIGGVLATLGVVIPNCVGVDIGCGMSFVSTNVPAEAATAELRKAWTHSVKRDVPVGFNHHRTEQDWPGFADMPDCIPSSIHGKAAYQLGTLGGGNHFIELQKNDEGKLCIMVHSGSRNFGYRLAKRYNDIAKDLCDRWYSPIPTKGEDGLAFLPMETDEAKEYFTVMNYALEFAFESRKRMLEAASSALVHLLPAENAGVSFGEMINIHHNFAAWEHHYGKNIIVHRKGATQAKKGQLGIIPGSMGTSSYIVRGLGNKESFESCSHGAGRVMGRGDANRKLTMDAVKDAMGDIVFEIGKSRGGKPDLSEAPQAYKDIDAVIAAESDLVEVVTKLSPLAVVKG